MCLLQRQRKAELPPDFRTWHGSVLALRLWRELERQQTLQPTAAQANRLFG
jgi:hypothetical protein